MSEEKNVRREVKADLVESTPTWAGLGYWILAAPTLGFLAWLWVDLIGALSPIASGWLNVLIELLLFALLIVLPFGYLAYWLITAFPALFQHAGWEVVPLEDVRLEEVYAVRYRYQARRRGRLTWERLLMRLGQGWTFLEIALILGSALALPAIMLSAGRFGFGS